MHCVTGWTTLDNDWEGVPFRALDGAREPTARGEVGHRALRDGYTSDLSLQAMVDDDVLVAWAKRRRGARPPEHGFPLRLVVPKRYAWKSAKWLHGPGVRRAQQRGFWEVRGYHIHAEPFAEERYSYQEGPRRRAEK